MTSSRLLARDEPNMAPEPPPVADKSTFAAFRYSDYDTPFWARSSTRAARWHEPADGPTQYLSLDPDAAWAEKARAEDTRTDADLALLRTKIWVALVEQRNVVDYGDFGRAEAAGFSPEALVDDDHSRCRAEGKRLREAGYGGVLAPSAALSGSTNLTLFGPRVRSTWGASVLLRSSVPACVVAVGAPDTGLATRVRFFGGAHSGLSTYGAQARTGGQPGAEDETSNAEKLF